MHRLYPIVCLFTFAAVFSLVTTACNDPKSSASSSLPGRWKLTKALRNQNATETLAGTFFQFNANGTMETNLPLGAGIPTPFELHDQEIRQKSTPPVVYKILESNDSSLVIVLEMRGVNFEMYFEKDLHPDVQDTLSKTVPVDTIPKGGSSDGRE